MVWGIGERATLLSVTRRRSSAPGRLRPARRRSLPWLLLPLLTAFVAAGCIGADQTQNQPSATPSSSATASTPSVGPTVEPSRSAEPTPTAAPTAAPTAVPTEPPASVEPSPADAGSVEACTGTDDNRTFFSDVAAAFDWPVYCAVLPAHWSVDTGRYRSAGGGWMEIAYKGPGGARFELHEGAFCDTVDGCVPAGDSAGAAAFGDLSGTLVVGDDGTYAVVVDRGAARSWLAVGVGLDLEVFKGFAADLALVE
jgi:hypothetical protein